MLMANEGSTEDRRLVVEEISPGESVLAVLPSMATPLSRLPEAAYGNLLVVTVRSPDQVERAIERAGHDPAKVGVVPVSASTVSYDGPLWVTERVSPSDLTGISVRFSEGRRHLAPERGWVVVDGIGTLLMYANDQQVYRLIAHLIEGSREKRLKSFHTLARDAVSEKTVATFRSLYDRVVTEE